MKRDIERETNTEGQIYVYIYIQRERERERERKRKRDIYDSYNKNKTYKMKSMIQELLHNY